jgi:O-antigen ligase
MESQEINRREMQSWKWGEWSLAALLAVSMLFNKLMPVVMVLTILSLIRQHHDWKTGFNRLTRLRSVYLWMVLFFLAHVVGLLFTSNYAFAYSDIGMKLSFLLFPLFFAFSTVDFKSGTALRVFSYGLVLTAVMCCIYSGYRFLYFASSAPFTYFTESYFSFQMHRSYFATYLIIGVLYFIRQTLWERHYRFLNLLLGLFLLLCIFLTFSKAGILILLLTLFALVVIWIVQCRKPVIGATSLILLVACLAMAIRSSYFAERFQFMFAQFSSDKKMDVTSVESNAARVLMWETASELFLENPAVGVGTGDVKDVLQERNYRKGYTGVAEKNLNAHNQYLNTGVQLGLLGLLPLLGMLFVPAIQAFRRRKLLVFLSILTFILTMLTESFLETQAGIMPVALLLCLLGNLRRESEAIRPA